MLIRAKDQREKISDQNPGPEAPPMSKKGAREEGAKKFSWEEQLPEE